MKVMFFNEELSHNILNVIVFVHFLIAGFDRFMSLYVYESKELDTQRGGKYGLIHHRPN